MAGYQSADVVWPKSICFSRNSAMFSEPPAVASEVCLLPECFDAVAASTAMIW